MKLLLLSILAALSTFGSIAQTSFNWSGTQDCNMSGTGALRPRIAFNAEGNPVVLWGNDNPGRNHVSVGNGTSFSMPVEVSAPGCEPSVSYWMGSSLAAVGNTVWVAMKAVPEDTKPIYVRRSDDGGFTWGDTIRVDRPDGLLSRFPSISVVDPDAPLVQYMQFDDEFSGARQVVTRMMGGAFMDPVQVSTPYAPGLVCDCCPGQLVTNADHAVALYRNAGSDIRVMWGAASTDGGASFPTGGVVDTTGWELSQCPSSGPAGFLAGDSIRYAWMSGANQGSKVYVGSALANDLTLGGQRLIYPAPMSTQQNYPRIAGNGDTLGVVWENQSNGGMEIMFSWSVTGVNGLSLPELVNPITTGTQRTPDIAFRNGVFHIVWGENTLDLVRYRKAALVNTTGIDGRTALAPVTFWPNPVRDVLHVDGTGWTTALILDAQGRTVAREAVIAGTLDLSHLAAGLYSISLLDRTGNTATLHIEKQ